MIAGVDDSSIDIVRRRRRLVDYPSELQRYVPRDFDVAQVSLARHCEDGGRVVPSLRIPFSCTSAILFHLRVSCTTCDEIFWGFAQKFQTLAFEINSASRIPQEVLLNVNKLSPINNEDRTKSLVSTRDMFGDLSRLMYDQTQT